MLPVFVLAGGLATRLRPRTHTMPKALIQVAGEPFINHQLRLLAENGIREVFMSVGFLGEQIAEAVGHGEQFGVDVQYIFDGPRLLGTGGAIAHALPILGNEFFILYGDSYLDIDYRAVLAAYRSSSLPALMTVYPNHGKWDASNVEFDGKTIVKYSKTDRNERMHYIDYGLVVVNRSVFDGVSDTEPSDLADVYTRLASVRKLAAFEVATRFYEIGSEEGIIETEAYLRSRRST